MSISGKKLGCYVNGVLLTGNYQWSARGTVDKLDRTTGSDGGYGNSDAGVRDMTATLQVYYDLTTGTGVAPQEGDVLTDVELFRDIDDATPAVTMPSALVTSCEDRGEVRGKMELSVEIVNKGTFTRDIN